MTVWGFPINAINKETKNHYSLKGQRIIQVLYVLKLDIHTKCPVRADQI